MSGILERVPAATVPADLLAPLRADPARSGRPARRRRHAGADRPPRRRRDGSRGHPLAPDRARAALRPGGLRHAAAARPRRGGSSSIGSIAYVGNHGGEVLRPGAASPRSIRRLRRWRAAGARVRRAPPTRPSCSACACASRTRARSSPSTGAERPTRAAADAALADLAEPRPSRGLHVALGAQGARGPAARAVRQGHRRSRAAARRATSTAALYVGDDATDLDAFRGLRELRARGAPERGVRIGVRLRRGAAGDRRARRTPRSTGPDGVRALLERARWATEPRPRRCSSRTSSRRRC